LRFERELTLVPESEIEPPLGGKEFDHHAGSLMPESAGGDVTADTVCPACGTGIVEGARFCGRCGRAIGVTVRPAHEGTTTILFTDIQGFTKLTALAGDQEALDILRRHNQIVRTQIQDHGGFEVKYQGDGFMVAFTTARRGVLCAIAIQKKIAEHNTEYPVRPLVLRMGLNAGDVLRDEHDFFGAAVNLAARIAEKAKGEQILMSDLVRGLVGPYPGFRYVSRGTHKIRGFPGRYKLYEIVWRS